LRNIFIPIASTSSPNAASGGLSIEELEKLKALHERFIFPIGVQHDPRIAPQGRIINAEIVPSGENEFFLQGKVEWFDVALNELVDTEGKEIRIRTFAEPTIIYDSHFKDPDIQELIYELSVLLKGRAEEEHKTENPFLSVLSIAASYPYGGIYKSFHRQFDRTGFKNFRVNLHYLLTRKTKAEERIISFIASMAFGNQTIQAEILLTNPDSNTIIRFFNKSLKRFDAVFLKQFQPGKGIRKMVYAYKDKDFEFLYALRKDGLPLEARKK
jgi:hypothetical protein